MSLRRIFSRRSPEEAFWRWFVANFDRLDRTPKGPLELKRAVDRYDRDLAWSIEPEGYRGDRCFTFGARGKKAKVEVVLRLVAAAPRLDGWRFQAFRPREPLGPVSVDEVTLQPEDIYFSILEDNAGEGLGVCFFVKGLDRRNPHSPHGEAAFGMIYALLGEYDALTKLGRLDFRSLAEVDGRQRPVRELPSVVDGRS
ncbi:MAG: hypothetical protein ACO1SV_07885 [Fimbriimonas sp.]